MTFWWSPGFQEQGPPNDRVALADDIASVAWEERMDLGQQMEQFSVAYLRAVAAAAGVALSRADVDDDSIDWGVVAPGGAGALPARPRVELQLKCTSQDVMHEHHLAFALKVKNYDDLRLTDLLVPRILVVVVVPGDVADWLVQTEEQLVVRHCAYWVSLRGLPDVDNEHTVTVHVPRQQVLRPASLREMLAGIQEGQAP